VPRTSGATDGSDPRPENEGDVHLNLVDDNYARAVIASRVAEAEQRRAGHRLLRARRLHRKAALALARAERSSGRAARADRRARIAAARLV
jgi:hypothetical protein